MSLPRDIKLIVVPGKLLSQLWRADSIATLSTTPEVSLVVQTPSLMSNRFPFLQVRRSFSMPRGTPNISVEPFATFRGWKSEVLPTGASAPFGHLGKIGIGPVPRATLLVHQRPWPKPLSPKLLPPPVLLLLFFSLLCRSLFIPNRVQYRMVTYNDLTAKNGIDTLNNEDRWTAWWIG